MIGIELPLTTVDEACRVVRALGGHRYVAGKQLLVHALVLAECAGEAGLWAKETLANADIDAASRDERLWRPCGEAELADILGRYWDTNDAARSRLREHLDRLELPLPEADPFDESREDDLHPLIIDAGWELLSLAELDVERHKGAINAFGEFVMYESARFEEQEAMPQLAHLYELPAIGPRELLEGAENGRLVQPFVLYTQGDETYLDYVIRGVLRAAKIG